MPHPDELEEVGLEVEHEHQALVPATTSRRSNIAAHAHSSPAPRLSLCTPTAEQRSLLQSSNSRPPSRLSRPGVLRWALLVAFLAAVAFFHVGREREEADGYEASLHTSPDVGLCEDDPDFAAEEGGCAFVAGADRGRCDRSAGVADHLGVFRTVKHFCRSTCGECGPKPAGGAGQEDVDEKPAEVVEGEGIEDVIGEETENVKEIEELIEEEEMDDAGEQEDEGAQEQGKDDQPAVDEDDAETGVNENGSEIDNEPNDNEPERANESGENESEISNESNENESESNENESEIGNESEAASGKGVEQSPIPDQEGHSQDTTHVDEAGGAESIASVDKGGKSDDNHSVQDTGIENLSDSDSGGDFPNSVSLDDEDQSVVSGNEEGGNDSQNMNDSVGTGSDAEKLSTSTKRESEVDNKQSTEDDSTPVGLPDFGGTFTPQRLQDTRKAAHDLVETLETYYGGEDQARRMMLGPWLDPWVFYKPDGAARNRSDKLVDTVARALLTDSQDGFVVGVIGSSVAAGHDNCRYDSYESQLERTFGPVWEAAGMMLEVQNSGQGGGCGDDFRNQAFCVQQNVSPDIDIVHYTWTYFEAGDTDILTKYETRESLIRWAQMLPHQPPVHVYNTATLPDLNWEKDEYELAERYAKYGYNAFYMQSGHIKGGYDYKADKKKGVDHFAWGFVGDGYHDVTRYGLEEPDPDRRESLGVVMRNWHPGPLAFEFTSDTFAYVYARAMLVALNTIEAYWRSGKDPREVWDASKRKVLLKRSLPDPAFCDPTYCTVDQAPGCLNYEKPTFGYWGAKVEDPDSGLNPHKGKAQNWEVWHEENDIWHAVGKQDTAIFQNRDDKEICRHPDQCGGISATTPNNGMVVFRLPKMEVGLVAICGCCGKTVAEEMFLRNSNIEIMYNGAVLDRAEWDVYPNEKCARLLKRFPADGAAPQLPQATRTFRSRPSRASGSRSAYLT